MSENRRANSPLSPCRLAAATGRINSSAGGAFGGVEPEINPAHCRSPSAGELNLSTVEKRFFRAGIHKERQGEAVIGIRSPPARHRRNGRVTDWKMQLERFSSTPLRLQVNLFKSPRCIRYQMSFSRWRLS